MDTQRLKMAREALGMSQEQLANAITIPQQMYSGYERGRHEPSAETLRRLCLALHVSSDYLLGINEADKAFLPDGGLSREEVILLRAFRNCPPEMQRVVLATAQAASSSSAGDSEKRGRAEANTA